MISKQEWKARNKQIENNLENYVDIAKMEKALIHGMTTIPELYDAEELEMAIDTIKIQYSSVKKLCDILKDALDIGEKYNDSIRSSSE